MTSHQAKNSDEDASIAEEHSMLTAEERRSWKLEGFDDLPRSFTVEQAARFR